MDLTTEEVRILGCLIEKSATTPDNYPLSTNALVAACNQKSSREPVLNYSERDVTEAMLLLRPAGLARTVTGGGRVEKHKHTVDEAWNLDPEQQAVLAVLALRGPQSAGELRTRTERYVTFDDLDAVTSTLESLANRTEPLVVDIGRGSGQSQNRWTHLLQGAPVLEPAAGNAEPSADVVQSTLEQRVSELEARLANIEQELGIAP